MTKAKRRVVNVLVGGLTVVMVGACSSTDEPSAAMAEQTAASPTVVELDTSFGTNGILRTALSATEADRIVAVARGAGGNIYGAGFATAGADQAMAVARITATGTLDPSFGEDGIVIVNVAEGGKTGERASGVAISSNGKIVLAGPIEHDPKAAGPAASDTDIAAVRLNADGSPDSSFGKNGISRIDLGAGVAVDEAFQGDTMFGVLALPEGKVLLVGAKNSGTGPTRDLAIVRLSANGGLDESFADKGILTVDINGGTESPRQAVLLDDGNVVVSGYTGNSADVVSPVLIKIDETGKLVDSFGTNGIATATILASVGEAYEVGVQGANFIITGYGKSTAEEKVDLIAARFTADGEWDKTFGQDGVARLDVAGLDDRGRDLVVLPDNRILIAGSGKPAETDQNGMLALLDENGGPAADFGEGGKLQLDLGGQTDAVFALTMSDDGKHVLVGGWSGPNPAQGGNEDALFVRLTLK